MSLIEDEGATYLITNMVFMGKILLFRLFKQFTIKEIINNMESTSARVITEGMAGNVFKFTFKLKENKELIYSKRPWSLNGEHLVLKNG